MHATQMDAARQGLVTRELRQAAAYEGIDETALLALVATGRAVIPANPKHGALRARAIGRTLKTKINVNLGTSRDSCDPAAELEKVRVACAMGADALMDLSTSGDTRAFRRAMIAASSVSVGTVPAYDAVVSLAKPLIEITADEWIGTLRAHGEDGVDFVTLHCGMNRDVAARYRANARRTGIVSRGGSLLYAWMEMTGQENPFYERYDEVLDICAEHDMTVSLGDACRPGCLADAGDAAQNAELIALGELVRRARTRGVQAMVEGPGHVALDAIAAQMMAERSLCDDAPFYVLGPIVTDIAPGYDHITAAIGGSIAAASGAAFLCYVTPAEHLRLPTLEDMKEGIVASRIAAHAADIAKGIPGARDADDRMADARARLDWEGMFALAIDPEKARRYREESRPEAEDSCTMCGKFCAVRNMNAVSAGEVVDVL